MPEYRVTFARSARKELEGLDRQVALRIIGRIEDLAGDARPPGVRKLRGANDLWRLRVGDYRVIYSVADSERLVGAVARFARAAHRQGRSLYGRWLPARRLDQVKTWGY